jgi:predicted HicB family RNase H-like nuclease
MGRPALGKISMTLRVRPRTREELYRLAAAEQITVSDYIEAVLIQHFEVMASKSPKP